MKTARLLSVLLLIALLVSIPVSADAHGFGGGLLVGLGAGLLTGLAVAPRPVYAPPVYIPPPVDYRAYPYAAAPAPAYGYSAGPVGPGCRAWSVIDRHWERRWDGYRWQSVVVERWGWVGVPCTP